MARASKGSQRGEFDNQNNLLMLQPQPYCTCELPLGRPYESFGTFAKLKCNLPVLSIIVHAFVTPRAVSRYFTSESYDAFASSGVMT